MRRTLTALAVTALLAVASPAVGVKSPPKVPQRDGQTITLPTPVIQVHSAPGSADGDGSWAWTFLGYHPDGWQIMAEAPSKAATTMRNLSIGQRVSFTGMVCGTFKVYSIDELTAPGSTDESDAVMRIQTANGFHVTVARQVVAC